MKAKTCYFEAKFNEEENERKRKRKRKRKRSDKEQDWYPTKKIKTVEKPERTKRKTKSSKKRRQRYKNNTCKKDEETVLSATLQTIDGESLNNDKDFFHHYHKFLRDDIGSNWQDSIQIGDVLEFNYSSTYKSRLSRATNNLRKHHNHNHNHNHNHHHHKIYDMPKWIPIQVICKAYSVTIEYIKNRNKTENDNNNDNNKKKRQKKPIQQKIKIGVSGSFNDHCKFKMNLKSAKIRPLHGEKNLYLKDGNLIEIFDVDSNSWQNVKLLNV